MIDLNAALEAAGDSSATRTVYGVVIALGVIGVGLLVLGIWLIKQTKPEPQLFAPLERMDDRAWRKLEPAEMRRDLDSLRPEGARPVLREKSVPDVDADFAQSRPTLATFDDLQAQLADDAHRATSGGNDPLLAPRPAPADDADESTDADEYTDVGKGTDGADESVEDTSHTDTGRT